MENSFGEFIKSKRLERNLTQKELSKILFVSESTISKWEKNVSHPDITLITKLSEILGVTEHELITASIDKQAREEKIQAKKWRVFSFTWSLFFYVAYGLALIPCFICNLAINKTLSWFWIVFCALLTGFTLTNLPKLIKRYKLILLPLSTYLALVLLLGVCCIYTKGNWFWIPTISILFALVVVFMPIYISKYRLFSKIKKFNDYFSIGIDFIMLNVLLLVIYSFTIKHNYTQNAYWYSTIALPITVCVYLVLNLFLSVRFLSTNRFIKTSIIMFLISALYLIPPILKVKNPVFQKEINDANILLADLSRWIVEITIEQNVHLIIFLTLLLLAIVFMFVGIFRQIKRKNI